jgi:lysine-specific demethylase 8
MRKARDVERVANMTREQFFSDYFGQQPVVMTGKINHWEALRGWSPEFFRERHGDVKVRVDRYDPKAKRTYLEQHIDYIHTEISFREFIDSLSDHGQQYTIRESDELLKSMPDLIEQMDHFKPFGSKSEHTEEQYSALWFSSAGDATGLHIDLVQGHLFHLYGRKRFIFFAPDQTPYLYEESHDKLDQPGVSERIEPRDLHTFRRYIRWAAANPLYPDYTQHPLLKQAEFWEVELSPGDVIYVPEGWWHATQSLSICISVTKTLYEKEFLQVA